MSVEPQGMAKRNTLAIVSLILGVLSIVLAPCYYIPGITGSLRVPEIAGFLRCVSSAACLLAVIAGVLGLRAARNFGGQGHKTAIAGIAMAGVSLLMVIGILTYTGMQLTKMQEAIWTTIAPQSFKGGGIQLTYPGDWQTFNMSQQDYCKQSAVECLLAIRHISGDGTSINLTRFALQRKASVEEADQELWKEFESSTPDVSLESRETIEISGQSAIRRIFNMPFEDVPGGRLYILQVYIVRELTLYQITSGAPSVEALEQHRAEIDGIITSISFAP